MLDHWFISGKGLAALRRNAVARLWWAAHLTCAPWESDPKLAPFKNADRYFYTKVLLRSQQVFQDTIERDFGRDPELLRAQVERTLRHEVAHHLGWGERGVRGLGL